jgi:hypothetical protein
VSGWITAILATGGEVARPNPSPLGGWAASSRESVVPGWDLVQISQTIDLYPEGHGKGEARAYYVFKRPTPSE